MIDRELLERFYTKIFSIPKKRLSVAIGIVSIILASVLNGIAGKAFFAQRYFFIGLAFIIALFILRPVVGAPYNSRRIFFLSLILLIGVEIFDFIVIHVSAFDLIVVAPASLTFFLILVMYFTSRARFWHVLLASILLLLFVYPVTHLYSFQAPHRLTAYITATLAGALFSFTYMRYIDRNIGGIAIKELLRGFILFWLTSDARYFEKELEKYGVERKGAVKCLSIGDIKIVSSTFHPGPIRNIGGGSLVAAFLERCHMYLHSASKHEDNPVNSEEVQKIVSSIVCHEFSLKAFMPFSVEGKHYKLHVFPFDHATFLILDGKYATDDLPSGLNEVAGKYFTNPLLCEAHNCHVEGFEVSAEDILEIEELFEKASEVETGQAELEYAFHAEKAESQSLCGHIAFLLLRYNHSGEETENYGILLLDSNNVEKRLKEKVEEFGSERGVKIIVASTDNHAKTGVSPKIGYRPAGMDDWGKVKDFLEEALKKEVKRAGRISYGSGEVVARVMGRRFFESVERAFREIGETAIYLFLILSSLNVVLTILLGLTIL